MITRWTKIHTKHKAALALIRFGVPTTPILNPQELINNPHIMNRKFIGPIDHPKIKIRRTAKIPWKINDIITNQQKPAPLVNQHTPKILTKLFEMSIKEIDELATKKILT